MKSYRELTISFRCGIIALAVVLTPFYLATGASISLDSSFNPPSFTAPDYASQVVLMPDGKYVAFRFPNTLTDQPTGAITRYLSDGTLDNTFNFSRDYDSVFAVAALQNGQLIVTAQQNVYGSYEYSDHILRLNTDGSIDPTFNTSGATISLAANPTTSNGGVRAIVIQADGKILLAGFFGDFGGAGHPGIVRLLADGTLDPGFAAITLQFQAENEYGLWSKPAIQAFDDKILISGDFEGVNNVPCPGVARLNPNGTLDPAFNATGFTRYLLTRPARGVVVQSDGKVIIGGEFKITGGPQDVPLARLNSDGSLDQSYVYPAGGGGFFGRIRDLIIQPNDKPIAGCNSVFRFNTNGSLDATFSNPVLTDASLFGFPQTYSLTLQANGKVLIGGTFSDVDDGGSSNDDHFSVARFNSNGTLDTTLTTSHKAGEKAYPTSFARQSNGLTLIAFDRIGGSTFNPAIPHNFGRLLADGSLNAGFDPLASLASGSLTGLGFTTLTDGKIFGFATNTVTPDFGYNVLLPNGTVADPSYKDDDQVKALGFSKAYPLPHNKVLVGRQGGQSVVDSTELQRLNSDGALDSSFQLDPAILADTVQRDVPGGPINNLAVGSNVVALFNDGKILFSYLALDNTFRLVRLKTNGSLDPSFQAGSIPAATTPSQQFVEGDITPEISAISVGFTDAQAVAGSKIVVVGNFDSYRGTAAHGIVRLNANGTVDSTFQAGGGAQWTQTTETATFHPRVDNIELENDGRFLITGTFEAFDGTAAPGIATLNANGSFFASLDQIAHRQKFDSFNSPTYLTRQPDGSFLLSGFFSLPNQTLSPSFIHIKSIGGVPIVGSPTLASVVAGHAFTYQTVASGQPTSYSATGLPPGFTMNSATGVISGNPIAANVGIYTVTIKATNGEGTGPSQTLVIIVAPSSFHIATNQRSPSQGIAFDGINYLVGLRADSGSSGEPRAQLVSPSGTLIGSQITTGRQGRAPKVAFNGTTYLLAWADRTNSLQSPVIGQLINKAGAKVGGTFRISESNTVSELDAIVGNLTFGGDKYLVTWTDDRRGTGSADHDIYARFVSGSGTPIGSDFKISGAAGADSAAAFDGSNYLVTWREDVNDTNILGRLIDPSGVAVSNPFLIDGNSFPSDSSPPAVIFDGTKYLVVFTDEVGGQGSETWDLFGRFVTTAGTVQANRITIDNASEAQRYPALAFDGSQYLVTWNNGLLLSDANATNVTINGRFFRSTGSAASARFTLFTPEGSKLPLFTPVLFDTKRFFAVGSLGDAVVDANNAITNFTNIVVDGQFIIGPPTITSPLSATATVGQQFVYQIIATRSPTSYGATGLPSGLSLNNVTGVISGVPAQAGTSQITIQASNASGTDTATLTLTVNPAPSAGPVITSATSQNGRTGQPFSFQILARETSPAARVSATNLPPGLTLDTTSGLIAGTPIHDGSFRVTITITDGSKSTTGTLQLTFTSDAGFPVITSPKAAAIAPGVTFTYKITAPVVTTSSDHTTFSIIGTLPAGLTFNPATGVISGVITAKAFREFHAAPEHAGPGGDIVTSKSLNDTPIIGSIDVLAHNSHGTGIQTLNLVPPASNPVLNISSRLRVQTGENVLIGGFIVIGSDSKKVLVRGIGPSLTGQGVSGVLADPVLELRDSASRLIKSNDNWKSSQRAEIEATGAAPTKDLESAIVTTLAPGRYTAILQGKNATTGIGLVEVYDLSASITSKLANISTRAFVSTGDNVMIGGFIIGPSGTGQTKVIIRAIGPSLSGAGITGIPLQDPMLELRNSTGALIAQNDNWLDTQRTEIQATGVPPTDIRESAIVKTLTPGRYTAIVRGKNAGTGLGVVEIYALQH